MYLSAISFQASLLFVYLTTVDFGLVVVRLIP
jgi:hypothetical protein